MDFIQQMGLLGLGSRLKRLGERLQGDVARLMASEGIVFGRRWGPLFHLLKEHGPVTIVEAAGRLGLTHPAVSQFSKEMARAGLVTSEPDARDERKRRLMLTRAGEHLYARIEPLLADIRAAMHGAARDADVDILDCLGRFEAALDRRSGYERVRQRVLARRDGEIEIVEYDRRYRDAFRDLNLEWIQRYFSQEDLDRRVLSRPEKEIIAPGGAILFARVGHDVLGTCALRKLSPGVYELCKMAVTPAAQGRGIGAKLGRAILDRARAMGARKVILETHHRLATAIHLYRKLGFVTARAPGHMRFARSDVFMEIDFAGAKAPASRRAGTVRRPTARRSRR
jgi:DNA-binding MarR family transcriptional regulator/N-acetylglutamate synthase-like GNAT family acetyltransferase